MPGLAAEQDAFSLVRRVARTCERFVRTFEGAFVRDVDSLSWMANNTRKLFPLQTSRPECWTFFSTAPYGRRNKVPQENIPKVTAEKVKEDMLGGVELALGQSKGSLQQPIYTRVQLWYNNACLGPFIPVTVSLC